MYCETFSHVYTRVYIAQVVHASANDIPFNNNKKINCDLILIVYDLAYKSIQRDSFPTKPQK